MAAETSLKIKGKWNAIGILRDVSERKILEEAIVRKSKVLFGINQVFEKELNCRTEEELAIQCLSEAEKLTGSRFGWIGHLNSEGRFDTMAMSDFGWDTCRMLESRAPLLIRNMEVRGYWGRVIKKGESQIVNDPDSHPDRVGVPEGHPPISSFLGVPLKEAGETIGMIGLANKDAGYDPADQQDLQALSVAFVEVLRRKRGERMLRESEEHYRRMANANMQLLEQAQRDGETKATLLREVNHRVKNNLSAIIGMLYAEKKFAREEDQDVYNFITKKLVDRLHGLSTTHALLSATEWAPLSLSELSEQVIRTALQTLPGDKQVSVEVTPSTVQVLSEQAHNLALVINELTINTVKHTLKERDAAHIAVRITPEDGAVGLEFRDDGPGYPEDVLRLERHRVGFDLIRNIVRKSLRGKLSLHNENGAVTVIRIESKEFQNV